MQTVVIERRTSGKAIRTTLQIGVEGGATSGAASASGSDPSSDNYSQWSTRWDGGHLIVWRLEHTVSDGQAVAIETSEDWFVDQAGQLVLTIQVQQTGRELARTVMSYRRQ